MDDVELLLTALHCPADADQLREHLGRVGGLFGLARAGAGVLDGTISDAAADRLEAIFRLADRLVAPPDLPARIEGPEDVVRYLSPRLARMPTERFWVLMLDARARPIGLQEVARGTLTACLVHPREVFAPAIRMRAASVLAVHNHPSGEATPSAEDVALTSRLADAGTLLGIPLVDHVVVSRSGFVSLGGSSGQSGASGTRIRASNGRASEDCGRFDRPPRDGGRCVHGRR